MKFSGAWKKHSAIQKRGLQPEMSQTVTISERAVQKNNSERKKTKSNIEGKARALEKMFEIKRSRSVSF